MYTGNCFIISLLFYLNDVLSECKNQSQEQEKYGNLGTYRELFYRFNHVLLR